MSLQMRYQRVVSLEKQVGIISYKIKLANIDLRVYWRWNQVPRRSKHPLPTGHTCCEPSFMIMDAEFMNREISLKFDIMQ
jgi:hypothetical protein